MTDGLVAALARCQAKFEAIGKNRENPHFKSKYADLAAILAVVRPVLANEGIALVQTTDITDSGVELVTALLSGEERIASRWPLPIDGLGSQQVGSLLSYMRRYQVMALVGVAPDDEDDGNAAADVQHRATTGKGTPPSDKSAQYLAKLRSEIVPDAGQWKLFSAQVLDGEIPDHPSGTQTSKLIDALLAAKKGMWPAGLVAAPSGLHVDDGTEPF